MKYYDFVDKRPPIGRFVVVEGIERVLADRALAAVIDRLLPADLRELNLQRFVAEEAGDFAVVREAAQAMPFLAERRVTIVTDAQALKAQARRELLAVAAAVPEGNTLIVVDLVSPTSKRPEPLGALAGRSALRIDVTAGAQARARFVEEALTELGATAEPRVVDALTRSVAGLAAVRNDLEKLALAGKKIALADLERESLSQEDPKAYRYASLVVEGRTAEAIALAHECFESNPRAAMALLAALATECGYLWEMARPGGELPARLRWRESGLRPLARRIGRRRARAAHERAVRGAEAVVTGAAGSDRNDQRALVERISVELSALGARRS